MKKRFTLHDKAEMALKEAVKEVIKEHKKDGRPLVIWKNGKIVKVSPYRISPQKK